MIYSRTAAKTQRKKQVAFMFCYIMACIKVFILFFFNLKTIFCGFVSWREVINDFFYVGQE